MSPAGTLTVYGAGPGGSRAVRFDPEPGISVTVQPLDSDGNERARALAGDLADSARALEDARRVEADLRQQIQAARARIAGLEQSLESAISGRRQFFAPVLLKPAVAGDWSGRVWLMDPERQERGRCLPFASLAEVRREHPELWVVGAQDGGVLLDAWGGGK